MTTTIIPTYLEKPVTLIEFDDEGHIRQIQTENKSYFVEWCEKYEVHLVDNFNGGEQVSYQYWLNSETVDNPHPDAKRIFELPEGVQQKLDDAWETSGSTVYCQVCKDNFISESEYECNHLWWVDSVGTLAGCGYCEHHDLDGFYKAPIFAVLDLAGEPSALALKESLLAHSYNIDADCAPIASCRAWYWRDHRSPEDCETLPVRFGHEWEISLDADDAKLEPAIAWLKSLESGVTKDADLITAKWIEEWCSR